MRDFKVSVVIVFSIDDLCLILGAYLTDEIPCPDCDVSYEDGIAILGDPDYDRHKSKAAWLVFR